MENDRQHLQALHEAARALLDARQHQMVTGEEWERLEAAVRAAEAAAPPTTVYDQRRS